jgi:hypothetical protein
VAAGRNEETAVFVMITALLLGTVAGRWTTRLVMLHDPGDPDLPCPWCMAPTFEDDRDCPTCGHRFGR